MTLAASGTITMAQINSEFGYGNDLNSYRGQQYWTSAGTHSTFSAGAIDFADFYSTRVPATATSNGYTGTFTGGAAATFASRPIGTAASDRLVVAVFAGADNTNLVASSVTIGGSAATIVIQDNEGGNSTNPFVCIATRVVTSGTTANIVCNLNGSPSTLYCATYSLYNLSSSTASDTAFDVNGTTQTVSLNIPINGWGVAVSTQITKTSINWTGITEDQDVGGSNAFAWGYTGWGTAAQSPRTIQVTNGSGDNGCTVSACWA